MPITTPLYAVVGAGFIYNQHYSNTGSIHSKDGGWKEREGGDSTLLFAPGRWLATVTNRRLYNNRFFARPLGVFFFSCFSTLGVWDLTLPARARDPCCLPCRKLVDRRRMKGYHDEGLVGEVDLAVTFGAWL
jgi:hypothetical protein